MDRFVTLAAALLDPATHTVTFVNAGHPTPMIYRKLAGKFEDAMSKDAIGLPLGVAEGYPYDSVAVKLEPGDCVLLFSDGVTDSMDKQNNQLQLRAVHAAVQDGPLPPQPLGEKIVKLVKQHAAGRSQHDDITLICFGRTA
jgi:serine phosphatase RsbU (regulator of sigma subunit)